MKRLRFPVTIILLTINLFAIAQEKSPSVNTEIFEDNARHWYGIFDKSNVIKAAPGKPRYKATDIIEIGDNILLFQQPNGGWPKNYDITAMLTPQQKDSLLKSKGKIHTTFDNGTTYTHIACLTNIYAHTKLPRFKDAAINGIEFLLTAQFDNGGWPQYFPLEKNYSSHITYNDGVMMGILSVLKDIADEKPEYAYLEGAKRSAAVNAYRKGIDCVLKTQIVENGKLLAWCQQHDEFTLKPTWARAFEPPSICNGESAELVLFLMTIKKPSPEIIRSIDAAVQWFKDSQIMDTRVEVIAAKDTVTQFRVSKTDRVVVKDPAAPPIWTRYYELGTHRPLFCNRDSKVVYSLAEVARERRDGYAWYTYNPQKVLNAYAKWSKIQKTL